MAAIKLREAGEKKGVQVSNKAEDIEEVYSSTVIAEDVDFPESNGGNDEENGKEMTDNTPEARVKIYKELAEQKKDKADREKANQPRKRDYDAEHAEAVVAAREKEEHTEEA